MLWRCNESKDDVFISPTTLIDDSLFLNNVKFIARLASVVQLYVGDGTLREYFTIRQRGRVV